MAAGSRIQRNPTGFFFFFSELFAGPFRDVPALWKRHKIIKQAARLVIGVFAARAQSSNFCTKGVWKICSALMLSCVVFGCILWSPGGGGGGGRGAEFFVEEIRNDNW